VVEHGPLADYLAAQARQNKTGGSTSIETAQAKHDRPGNGYDAVRGDSDRHTQDDDADKPYGPIRANLVNRGYRVAHSFEFKLPDGTVLFTEDRYELAAHIKPTKERPRKECRIWHLEDGKKYCDTGPRRIIYNWPSIMSAGPGATVYVVEGANKANPLIAAGLLATAAPYHQWGNECVEALAGRHIIYLEDHDHPKDDGQITAKKLSANARTKLAPRAASFRIAPAKMLWENLGRAGEPPHGWDVKDWLEAGGDDKKLRDICRGIPNEEDNEPLLKCGVPDTRPRIKWRIKQLMPTVGVGLLSGQWGTNKTFQAIEIATTIMTPDQSFCGREVREPCGTLILATEGDFDLRDRVEAAVQTRYPELDLARAPIWWCEGCPTLLAAGATEQLIARIQSAATEMRAGLKLPLGLVIIDVLTDAAGYTKAGEENDAAIIARIFDVLRRAAKACNCFILAVDHFGKTIEAGTRGSAGKEGGADLILATLGQRDVSGNVVNTRLAFRKVRSGPQGQEFPFGKRLVPVPNQQEDGNETTCVIVWEAAAPVETANPWGDDRQSATKLAMLNLRRAMMKVSANGGLARAPEAGADVVMMLDEEAVRDAFFDLTVVSKARPNKGETQKPSGSIARLSVPKPRD